VSQPTFYREKKKFGVLGLMEIRRLKELEEVNFKPKRLVADLSLNKAILQYFLQNYLKIRFTSCPAKSADRACESRTHPSTVSLGTDLFALQNTSQKKVNLHTQRSRQDNLTR
jgi:hypothetical protein